MFNSPFPAAALKKSILGMLCTLLIQTPSIAEAGGKGTRPTPPHNLETLDGGITDTGQSQPVRQLTNPSTRDKKRASPKRAPGSKGAAKQHSSNHRPDNQASLTRRTIVTDPQLYTQPETQVREAAQRTPALKFTGTAQMVANVLEAASAYQVQKKDGLQNAPEFDYLALPEYLAIPLEGEATVSGADIKAKPIVKDGDLADPDLNGTEKILYTGGRGNLFYLQHGDYISLYRITDNIPHLIAHLQANRNSQVGIMDHNTIVIANTISRQLIELQRYTINNNRLERLNFLPKTMTENVEAIAFTSDKKLVLITQKHDRRLDLSAQDNKKLDDLLTLTTQQKMDFIEEQRQQRKEQRQHNSSSENGQAPKASPLLHYIYSSYLYDLPAKPQHQNLTTGTRSEERNVRGLLEASPEPFFQTACASPKKVDITSSGWSLDQNQPDTLEVTLVDRVQFSSSDSAMRWVLEIPRQQTVGSVKIQQTYKPSGERGEKRALPDEALHLPQPSDPLSKHVAQQSKVFSSNGFKQVTQYAYAYSSSLTRAPRLTPITREDITTENEEIADSILKHLSEEIDTEARESISAQYQEIREYPPVMVLMDHRQPDLIKSLVEMDTEISSIKALPTAYSGHQIYSLTTEEGVNEGLIEDRLSQVPIARFTNSSPHEREVFSMKNSRLLPNGIILIEREEAVPLLVIPEETIPGRIDKETKKRRSLRAYLNAQSVAKSQTPGDDTPVMPKAQLCWWLTQSLRNFGSALGRWIPGRK